MMEDRRVTLVDWYQCHLATLSCVCCHCARLQRQLETARATASAELIRTTTDDLSRILGVQLPEAYRGMEVGELSIQSW